MTPASTSSPKISFSSRRHRLLPPATDIGRVDAVLLSHDEHQDNLDTATPALHGPEGSEPIVGEVIGFMLTGQGLPTVYISGDNVSLDRVRRVVPVHCDSWAHFSEGLDEIVTAFTDAEIADRLDVAR